MLTRARSLALGALGALAVVTAVASGAHATPYGSLPVTVELGPGIVAERYASYRIGAALYDPYGGFAWRVTGLALPPGVLGERANMFAAARGGRVVMAVADGVLYTDDRGAHWHRARWESSQSPLSLAFDAGSDFGAAVGTNGAVWTTEDRGQTWRLRRDNSGQQLVDVAVAGTTLAFADANGGVWVSPDGGVSVRTIAERATATMPVLQAHDRAVWVLTGGSVWWRAADGMVERVEATGPPAR